MRISDWSSDVCSSDLGRIRRFWRFEGTRLCGTLATAWHLDAQPSDPARPGWWSVGSSPAWSPSSDRPPATAPRSWASTPTTLRRRQQPSPDRWRVEWCQTPFDAVGLVGGELTGGVCTAAGRVDAQAEKSQQLGAAVEPGGGAGVDLLEDRKSVV